MWINLEDTSFPSVKICFYEDVERARQSDGQQGGQL
jgi:hypothetical protein